MNSRLLWLLPCAVVLWQCATSPLPATAPVQAPLQKAAGPDDDHRPVSREEFQASAWQPLPKVSSWKALADGASVTLADGRELSLTFVAPAVVRWWVPSAAGDQPLSPAAVYGAPGQKVSVQVKEVAGTVYLDTPGLGMRWSLSDLSWTLIRGDATVVRTAGGPRVAGRRLNQAFHAEDAARWVGPGLEAGRTSARAWIEQSPQPDGSGPFAVPVVFGAGGALPFVAALDSSYQCYTRVSDSEASLGALNGGLDLLVAAAPKAAGTIEALTTLVGRPGLPPLWVHGTALVVPAAETGTFVRSARLAIQTALGPENSGRASFQAVVVGRDQFPVPDLTQAGAASSWAEHWGLSGVPQGAGVWLTPLPGRLDWGTTFDDGGRQSPLARMNNRLPVFEAQAAASAQASRAPGLRPFVLAGSAALGSVRSALPEISVAVDDDSALARVLALGVAGVGTPAVRLDLTSLAVKGKKNAAFQLLLSWLMAPVLTLDWGPDPATLWAGLSETDQKRLKSILERRSQFKPLFDQVARQAAATGRPEWAPLWFAAPNDPQALSSEDEFLLGEGLLAAPVAANSPSRSVYLPGPGVWFDFWSGEEYGGGKAYTIESRPDRPLLFARAGSFIPVREAEAFDGKDVYNPLTVHVFPGDRGAGAYYRDDGTTLAWKDGGAWETRLTFDFTQKTMSLDHEAVSTTGLVRPDPYLMYRLHNVYRPKGVKIDGKPIPLFGDSWGITDTDRSAAWYESDHTLLLKTFRPEREQTIDISF